MNPSLILINPWIYDFAAYDLWSKPLGLLYLASHLRSCGFQIHLIDCLDVHHPGMKDDVSVRQPVRRHYGTGKFQKQKTLKLSPLEDIPRPYYRYGIPRRLFIKELMKIRKPSAILVTSLMTYWYPGVRDAISLAKEIHPNVPVILGGIYARLCTQHALQSSGADHVVDEVYFNKPASILNILDQFDITIPEALATNHESPYPAFDLLHSIDYISLLTSTGCPYRCRYCASHFLYPRISRRDPFEVLEEIIYWHRQYGIKDFAFYDDALLIESNSHITVLLENLLKQNLNLRFHTPNALHVREITPDISRLLYLSGFRTIRLGYETSDMNLHIALDKKVSEGEFERGVLNLKRAGFTGREAGVYILMGLPGQSVESVIRTIKHVGRIGATPFLAEYSPIPNTPLWKEALSNSRYDLASEPLFHNNTLMPCWDIDRIKKIPVLKKMIMKIRQNLS
ncbi:MAG: cobalamin-dependent protein [Thermodesulfobacteriota bacterium]|nr:cobalamin-dependent protein [Thermodesulfobacteriota bacterium]